jgi:hypothetical protein
MDQGMLTVEKVEYFVIIVLHKNHSINVFVNKENQAICFSATGKIVKYEKIMIEVRSDPKFVFSMFLGLHNLYAAVSCAQHLVRMDSN